MLTHTGGGLSGVGDIVAGASMLKYAFLVATSSEQCGANFLWAMISKEEDGCRAAAAALHRSADLIAEKREIASHRGKSIPVRRAGEELKRTNAESNRVAHDPQDLPPQSTYSSS